MNYRETEAYIFSKLPNYQAVGSPAFNKSLDKTLALSQQIGNPHRAYRTVHIAGTNGKGSVASLLTSILMEQGYRVGLYTSPHLLSFRERIKINGEVVSEPFVVSFVGQIQSFIEEHQPSFFEITTLMALEYFKQQEVDIAIIETGLGGRLDSTNIVEPILSVITSIGMDHQHILGNTDLEIAREKAGIIKPGTDVVLGSVSSHLIPVFRSAANDKHVACYESQDLDISDLDVQEGVRRLKYGDTEYDLGLLGGYQLKNVKTVFKVIELMRDQVAIETASVKNGLKRVVLNSGLQGRFQYWQTQPSVILDVAHNEEGIREVLNQINAERRGMLHCVFGMVKDKSAERILSLFPNDSLFYVVEPQMFRAMSGQHIHKELEYRQLQSYVYPNIDQGYQAALSRAEADDVIYVGGSSFVVADFLQHYV